MAKIVDIKKGNNPDKKKQDKDNVEIVLESLDELNEILIKIEKSLAKTNDKNIDS